MVGVGYTAVTTVLFVFPPVLPVTGSNMNYCVVVFALILGVSAVQWWVDGRRNFKGPRVEEGAVRNAEVEVLGVAVSGEDEGNGKSKGRGRGRGQGSVGRNVNAEGTEEDDVKYKTAL